METNIKTLWIDNDSLYRAVQHFKPGTVDYAGLQAILEVQEVIFFTRKLPSLMKSGTQQAFWRHLENLGWKIKAFEEGECGGTLAGVLSTEMTRKTEQEMMGMGPRQELILLTSNPALVYPLRVAAGAVAFWVSLMNQTSWLHAVTQGMRVINLDRQQVVKYEKSDR